MSPVVAISMQTIKTLISQKRKLYRANNKAMSKAITAQEIDAAVVLVACNQLIIDSLNNRINTIYGGEFRYREHCALNK